MHSAVSPFIIHLVITWIWLHHGHLVAANIFNHEILQRKYRKMTIKWSFPYYSFVKLSLYNEVCFYCPKRSFIKGLHCILELKLNYFIENSFKTPPKIHHHVNSFHHHDTRIISSSPNVHNRHGRHDDGSASENEYDIPDSVSQR